ncbi:MAG: hypothetical protein KIT33_02895 [Candidatus Kapabacteria bacterium]|nr:hypothetical protein [Ignavibacteriota bacterium]MCW5883897.1 hypothetical protein [Candidatus Kapabacteria bacterium]
MVKKEDAILFSGAAPGAEAHFGTTAEKFGIEEVNFSFEGHEHSRLRGIRILNHEELKQGDISLTYASKIMNREYPKTPTFRKILQTIWYQINNGQEIYVIGKILDDKTVKGGTGWGAEFGKICNKPLFVFDQDENRWFKWNKEDWISVNEPLISSGHFTGTGTRLLKENGKKAIEDLFKRSFSL